MNPHAISKTPLASDPDKAQAQLEELAGTLAAKDAAAGQQLRAVAVELVRRGLQVTLVDYHGSWTELEATLPQAPHLGPVTLDRDAAGTTCQLAWDCWADISTPASAGQAAGTAAALLRALASCPPPAGPSALTATPDPAPPGTLGQHPGQAARPGRHRDPRSCRARLALPVPGLGRADQAGVHRRRAHSQRPTTARHRFHGGYHGT